MDVAVFRPLKEHWRQDVHSFKVKNLGTKLKRENFAPLMDSVLQQLKPESFINGFRCCGIYPLNKYAVNYKKYFKNNTGQQPVTEPISREMLRIHFKFLQTRISLDKITRFENNDPENGDESLYQMWKKLKEDCDLQIINISENTEINDAEESMQQLQNQISDETEQRELVSEEESVVENRLIGETTNQETSPRRPYTTSSQLPSPFKNVFILPERKLKDVKKAN